jgi:hypothetical protein
MNLKSKSIKVIEKLASNKQIDTIYYYIKNRGIEEYVWYHTTVDDEMFLYIIDHQEVYKLTINHRKNNWISNDTYCALFNRDYNVEKCFDLGYNQITVLTKDSNGIYKIKRIFTFDLECLKKTMYEEKSFGRFVQREISTILNDYFFESLYYKNYPLVPDK